MSTKLSLCHWGAFEATIEYGRLISARPWHDGTPQGLARGADPDMIGALPDYVYASTRIDRPHVRAGWLEARKRLGRGEGGGRGDDVMVPISWDEALDLAADEIARVRDTHGHKALFAGSYGWSSAGRFHHARTQIRRFYGALGGYTDQTGNYSWGAAQVILEHVLGDASAVSTAATSWDTVARDTDVLVAFGGLNPKNWRVTAGGAGCHHMPEHIARAQRNGVKFIVLSPFADDIPEGLQAEWIAPRPGSDTAIMLALTAEMIARGRADRAFIARYTSGWETLEAYLTGAHDGTPKSLAWAAAVADVPEASLKRLADQMETGRVMLTAAWSLQRAHHGEMTYWALIALAASLGQIGLPGSGFTFGYGSLNAVGQDARKGLIPSLPTLGNAKGMAIPVARIADMLAAPGAPIPFDTGEVVYPDIRLIHWAGGNPFHHAQDLFRLDALWQRPETIIVNEQFWTATAQRADIVFPATTALERDDIGGSSRDPHVFYMPKLIEPVGEARSDFEIFQALAERLSHRETFDEGLSEEGWLARLWQQSEEAAAAINLTAPTFEALKAMGVWRVPLPDTPEVLLGAYRADPDAHPLKTPSGRIEISSPTLAALDNADVPAHPLWRPPVEWLGSAQPQQLSLASRQPAKYLHSQLAQTGLRQPAEILLHAEDARQAGIDEGDAVHVRSARGACGAIARLTTACRRGVAAMETGPWFDGRDGFDIAGNPNALTLDIPASPLSQATAAQTCLVTVHPAAPEHPATKPFNVGEHQPAE